MKMNKKFNLLFAIFCYMAIILVDGSFEASAAESFIQGSGYEQGNYDLEAIQPTAFNWTRQSRFSGSEAFDMKWSFKTEGRVRSSPAIAADGTIYVGSDDGHLYALTASGEQKWKFAINGSDFGNPGIYSSPSIGADGTIYVGGDDSYLYAIHPDGTLKWDLKIGSLVFVSPSPAIGADGTIYVATQGGTFHAISDDGDTGREKWAYKISAFWPMIRSSPVIAADGKIYVADSDGILYAFEPEQDADDVKPKWTFETETGSGIRATPAIGDDGTIYLGSEDGNLYVLDSSGQLQWRFDAKDSIYSTPVIGSDGTIYIKTHSKLYAFAPQQAADDVSPRWSAEFGYVTYATPIVDANGILYVGTHDSNLYAIDSAGNLRWSFQAEGSITSSAAIGADGTIYVGSYDGHLYAIGQVDIDAPTNVTANAGEGSVQLEWEAVSDASAYAIYMATGSEPPDTKDLSNWKPLNDEPLKDTSWLADELKAGTTYWFAVQAVTEGNSRSQLSEPVSATPYAVVKAVNDLNTLEVSKHITSEQLAQYLPTEVSLQLHNETLEPDVGVNWEIENSDYNPDQSGTYWISGSLQLPEYYLNPDKLKVKLQVRVLPGSNAKLSEIRINGKILENFNPDLFTYYLTVPYSMDRVTVTASTYDSSASYEVIGGQEAVLEIGDNSIYIQVISENEQEERTYSLYIERLLTIAEIQRPDTIYVPYNTKLQDVSVPDSVYVTLDDLRTIEVQVSWNEVHPEYNGKVAGRYEFIGTLQLPEWVNNPLNIKAKVSVIVLDERKRSSSSSPSSRTDRVSSDAKLSSLEIWANGRMLTLQPSFAPDVHDYTVFTDAEEMVFIAQAAHDAAEVYVDGVLLSRSVPISKKLTSGNNEFTFVVRAEDGTEKRYTLTVIRETATHESSMPFSDIAGHWAEDYIMRAVEKGIVSGYPDGTFKPNHPVTRAEFTVMLAGVMKLEGDGSVLTFTDHDQIGAWAKQAVAQAVQAGIVVGYSDGSFRPNTRITRAEMAVMIARALQLELNANASTGFADDETIPQWAKGAVEAIRKLGIVDGRGGNRFVPNETATRAEATVMLLRLLDR
ncbi:outer membrane biogenesis protein BamB [Chlamydia abortus]|nr:outer membrane biogenesis protein BamB [Chlamydia abortus]